MQRLIESAQLLRFDWFDAPTAVKYNLTAHFALELKREVTTIYEMSVHFKRQNRKLI